MSVAQAQAMISSLTQQQVHDYLMRDDQIDQLSGGEIFATGDGRIDAQTHIMVMALADVV